jgi:hypothetical protein
MFKNLFSAIVIAAAALFVAVPASAVPTPNIPVPVRPTNFNFAGDWVIQIPTEVVLSPDGDTDKVKHVSYQLTMGSAQPLGTTTTLLYHGNVIGTPGGNADMYYDPTNAPNFLNVFVYVQDATGILELNFQMFINEDGTAATGLMLGELFDIAHFTVPRRIALYSGQSTLSRPGHDH